MCRCARILLINVRLRFSLKRLRHQSRALYMRQTITLSLSHLGSTLETNQFFSHLREWLDWFSFSVTSWRQEETRETRNIHFARASTRLRINGVIWFRASKNISKDYIRKILAFLSKSQKDIWPDLSRFILTCILLIISQIFMNIKSTRSCHLYILILFSFYINVITILLELYIYIMSTLIPSLLF